MSSTFKEECTIHIEYDGDVLCAKFSDFENLEESPAGFGLTVQEAINDLLNQMEP